MDTKQLAFYQTVAAGLAKGEFVPLGGEIGYAFAYLYGVLAAWHDRGFENIHDYLTHVSELYSEEPKLADYCLLWAADCLLARDQFDLYLERTSPKTATKTHTHLSNLRINVHHHLGLPPNSVDIVTMLKGRASKLIVENEGEYRRALDEVFAEHEDREGNWYDFLRRDNYGNGRKYSHSLFQGSPIGRNPKLSFELESFYATRKGVETVKELTKEAENRLRRGLKIPLIGEGWVSETRLFRMIESAFPETQVVQHGQPPWLRRQHLDIWIPAWRVAVEYHGKQHFEPVEFFGGSEAYRHTVERDQRKLNLCRRHSVKLIIVTERDTHEGTLQQIRDARAQVKTRVPLPPQSQR